MESPFAHAELWIALATASAAAAAALFRMGQKWGTILALVQDLHRNQQAIANWAGIKLPHPLVGDKKHDDNPAMGGAASQSK